MLMCLAAVLLYARSYFTFDDAVLVRPKTVTNIVSLYGRLYLQFGWSSVGYHPSSRYAGGGWFLDSLAANPTMYGNQSRRWDWLGFGTWYRPDHSTGQITGGERTVMIPYWFFVLLTLIVPALAFRRTRRERRHLLRVKDHLCSKCGYDLRATPDRCPECGTIPPIGR